MVKFFKKKPKMCGICGKETTIHKSIKKGLTEFNYCKPCYDECYKKVETRVKKQVMAAVKAGKMISMQDALGITKKITTEIEKENEKQDRINWDD